MSEDTHQIPSGTPVGGGGLHETVIKETHTVHSRYTFELYSYIGTENQLIFVKKMTYHSGYQIIILIFGCYYSLNLKL